VSELSQASLETPVPGELVELFPGVLRLTAPNPSLMTGPGTNSYLVGEKELVAIDPGPEEVAHLEMLAELAGGRLKAILVTHAHPDHAPGARKLSELTGAVVCGYDERAGFVPDRRLGANEMVELGDFPLQVVHTPGHASDHLCFLATETGRLLFSGDHVMGGSTVVIAPPDGDMTEYLSSLERLVEMKPGLGAIAPGHGPALGEPAAVLSQYISHRLAREKAVLAVLFSRQEATIDQIVADVYTDVAPEFHPIARYSVWAHLLKLEKESRACSREPLDIRAPWRALGGS
jgi:glyoxylase-like metal-dependent hydrolase (beta-lactamase superfamily II)